MASKASVTEIDQRPEIIIAPGEGHRAVEQVLELLSRRPEPLIFRQGTQLVKLVGRNGKTEVAPFTRHVLANTLTELFQFKKPARDKQGNPIKLKIDCPLNFSQTILELGAWPLPVLRGIVSFSMLRADGTLISEPGFDVDSGLYLTDTTAPELIESTKEAAEDGLQLLEALLSDFPFVSDEDAAAAIAMFIGCVVRQALDKSPAYGITAPTPGTGKTVLSEAVLLLLLGYVPPVIPMSTDAKEAEKTLSAALQARIPALFFDDIKQVIRWPFLAPVLTSSTARVRVLGLSRLDEVPTNSAIIFNGNNLTVHGDLVRRFLMINLDAGIERPEQRQFSRDIMEYIDLERDALVGRVLSIVKAYCDAGFPDVDAKPSGFPQWDRFVRYPLIWLGRPDPLKANAGIREGDRDMRSIAAVCAALLALPDVNKSDFSASQVCKLGGSDPDLHEALAMACSDKYDSTRIGNWLSRVAGRPVDGMKIVKSHLDRHAKHYRWAIEEVGTDEI